MQATFQPVSALFEQYRPATFDSVIGMEKAKRLLDGIRKRCGSLFGRAYWISGKSGTGKTTFANLIAREGADEWAIEELDAGSLTVAELSRIEQSWAVEVLRLYAPEKLAIESGEFL
jgi:replication-associated recombination protein RarA